MSSEKYNYVTLADLVADLREAVDLLKKAAKPFYAAEGMKDARDLCQMAYAAGLATGTMDTVAERLEAFIAPSRQGAKENG